MARPDNNLLRKLQETFKGEAIEHLQTLNTALLQLERATDEAKYQALLHEAFRAAHNLKGAARTAEFKEIQQLAHSIETIFQQVRDNKLSLTPANCDVLYRTLDAIKELLDGKAVDAQEIIAQLAEISPNGSRAASEPIMQHEEPELVVELTVAEPHDNGSSSTMVAIDDTLRVALTKLDALMADAGELITSKISAEQQLDEMLQVQYQLSLWPKTLDDFNTLLRRVNGKVGSQLTEILVQHQDYLQGLTQNIDVLQRGVARNTLRLGMITNRIQDEVRQVRLVPFESIVGLLQRTVRDAARSEGKHLDMLHISGAHIELDKKVLEVLKDPLLHLLSNAVAHGIESQAERLAAGKPAEGKITVTVQQRGNEVSIEVTDDGRGFDLVGLRESSARQGGPQLEPTADVDKLLNLAFLPGVSTAVEVTEIAGRGVGLDVVRQNIETLQGRVAVKSTPGKGTAFQLVVPVSLTTTQGLLVCTGDEQYILPLLSIDNIIRPAGTFTVEGQLMVTVDNQPIPLLSLAAALNRPFIQEVPKSRALAVVVKAADQRIALLVDDILAQQEVTIKPLSKLFKRVPGVAGAAILGGGEPVLVLDALELAKSTQHSEALSIVATRGAEPEQNGASPEICILVVDDSITTRTLEKNILQAAGYRVVTATDGELALKQLKENPVTLIVSDVQMPNKDGIALTLAVRESQLYNQLPIILVTSLESVEDRERGLLAGANAYIVKRGFDQAELLSTIERLL